MAIDKMTFDDSLMRNIVSTDKCFKCAACVVACPFGCLEYVAEEPRLAKECKACGLCTRVCPLSEWSSSEIERHVFGRERRCDEESGIYRRMTASKANDARVLRVCQDGGVVTALLLHALESGLIDGAIVSGINGHRPFYPVPKLATTAGEILQSAGTRYSYSPNLLALPEAIGQKRKSVAFVGTPCQISAVRRMQMCKLKLAANVKLLIGLMCSECFMYEGLIEKHIHRNLSINLGDIEGINIKGKMIVRLKSNSSKVIPLAEVKQYARKSCGFCRDFSSELADISAGGLGLEGWTFTVIRTKDGEKLFNSAENYGAVKTKPVEKDDSALTLLVRLSRKKLKSSS